MPRLLLLRHAKSSWDTPGIKDHARILNPRGRRACETMARYLAKKQLEPDKVLCSTAARTRETLTRIHLMNDWPVIPDFLDSLYLASEKKIVEQIARHGGESKCVLVVGHNPGLEKAALLLDSGKRPELTAAIQSKFPTAALAVFDIPGPWSDLDAGTGDLIAYTVPRDLEDID